MKTFTSVLVAGFAALAQAVQLTNSNYNVQAGEPFIITWSDAQGPVTLTLKNGPSTNLNTVQIIASGQSGDSYTWTPPSTLASDQYAIEITDGTGTPNYSEQFTLATDVTASASVSSAVSTVSSAVTSLVSVSSTITSSVSLTSSVSSAETSAVSSAANSTIATSTRATRTSATGEASNSPTTVPTGDSARIGSPIALIGLTVAAMLYFQ
ncbi:hypothetical protein CTA2_173 [Colletotrichum tanaceti]|uniref:Yeast cell wall synthesis Kre9/Knh1-like N-terminal domain-containing protein n=1 Tax=Colletotrichum tanaceti TaxID=1306861 RepID=A0A4V6Y9G4_9PEZI|nr:hypothetical protein CTA2_173 [Colletotrichum tanaceti]TKW54206.1 hypothetical protein CTA1_1704 [Colletotrichum tanaceti]